jgi:hypothetical protein
LVPLSRKYAPDARCAYSSMSWSCSAGPECGICVFTGLGPSPAGNGKTFNSRTCAFKPA